MSILYQYHLGVSDFISPQSTISIVLVGDPDSVPNYSIYLRSSFPSIIYPKTVCARFSQ